MSVYLDPLMPCRMSEHWRWPMACHLFGDSLTELHDFAARVGLKHSWFQHQPGKLPHYDVNDSMRRKAVAAGAIELSDRWEIVQAYARCGDGVAAQIIDRGGGKAAQA